MELYKLNVYSVK